MPLFICDKCKCVENTALSPTFWTNRIDKKPLLCSECETGKWHEKFEKKKWDGEEELL